MIQIEALDKISTRFGDMFVLPSDSPIGESLRHYGEWSGVELQFLEQFVTLGSTVIDGGANIGSHTLAFAEMVGAQGRVLSIEASADLTKILEANVAGNSLSNVTVLNRALDELDRTVMIQRVDPNVHQNSGALRVEEFTNSEQPEFTAVKTLRLDDLDIKNLSLLKLDIEGAEPAAIGGAARLIDRERPVVVAEMLSLENAVPVVNIFRSANYKVYFCSFTAHNPHNFRGADTNLFGFAREAALLFLPSEFSPPTEVPCVHMQEIHTFDALAQEFFEMPRYGDSSDHERIVEKLVLEKNRLEILLKSDVDGEVPVSEGRLKSEIEHVWASVINQQDRIERMEKLGQDEIVASIMKKLEQIEAGKVEDTEAFRGDVLQSNSERNYAELRDHATASDRRMVALETSAAELRDLLARLSSELGAAVSRTSRLMESLQNLETKAAQSQSDLMRAVNSQKADMANLKEALLGRIEDRSNLVLTMEGLVERLNRVEAALTSRL